MKSNLTIGTKLMAAVGGMVALTVILAVSSLLSIGGLKGQFDHAIDENVVKIGLADTISKSNSDMISMQRGAILAAFAKDPAELEADKRAFLKSADLIRKAIEDTTPLIRTDEGRRLVDDLTAAEAEWMPHFQEVARQCDTGNVAEANRIRKEITAPIYNRIAKAATDLVALDHTLVERDRAAAAADIASSRWICLFLLVLTVALGAAATVTVRHVSGTLRKATDELYRGAEEVASAAAQVAASSQSLANGASSQAASLQETSASSEEIRAMATQNTETTRTAAGVATESERKFQEANAVLDQMVVAMDQINDSSAKIARIIKVIDEIAFQTNILALNAAVEAARAGEAGLGFAVVADEVRNLAQRCAQAAKDTAALIEDSSAKSAEGKMKVDQVAGFIRVVTSESNQVKTLVDEVNLGSQEQVRGIEQVAKAIVQMERLTQGAAASAEQGAAAAEELTAQSKAVREVVGRLAAMVGTSA